MLISEYEALIFVLLKVIASFQNKYENTLGHRTMTTVTAAESRLKGHIDRRFELPLIEDKTVVFSITNDAKITEYQWIALRDHCAQVCSLILRYFFFFFFL